MARKVGDLVEVRVRVPSGPRFIAQWRMARLVKPTDDGWQAKPEVNPWGVYGYAVSRSEPFDGGTDVFHRRDIRAPRSLLGRSTKRERYHVRR